MKTQTVAVSLAMTVLVIATSVVSNNKLTFAAAGKPNDIAGKVENLGLAGVLRAVASGTIEIYDDAGKRAYRFDRSIHQAGYFRLSLTPAITYRTAETWPLRKPLSKMRRPPVSSIS